MSWNRFIEDEVVALCAGNEEVGAVNDELFGAENEVECGAEDDDVGAEGRAVRGPPR